MDDHCFADTCSVNGMHSGGFEDIAFGTHGISLDWTGPNAENVYGTYQTREYMGAFGGVRQ